MRVDLLDFSYPESLIATERRDDSRVMWVEQGHPLEITKDQLLEKIRPGDLVVLNETKVLRRRVFAGELEILFLGSQDGLTWEVLFPSRKMALGAQVELPTGHRFTLKQKGRPQLIELDRPLAEADFEACADLPLPPYIQKARGERRNRQEDPRWYQTEWAQNPGSLAAPTASFHFRNSDWAQLRRRGVRVEALTLHVGLGTFLPVTAEDLSQHEMHQEVVEIPAAVWIAVQETRRQGGRVWSLGTTVVRSLESAALGLLPQQTQGGFRGDTRLLIQPGFEWKVVDVLMTNFHQPRSTLLALVAAFAGLETVKACYSWAIEREFRLFSYGDLSVWTK